MERLLAGYRPDEAKTLIFLQALETIGFRGYTIPELAETANLTPEQNVQGFVEALRNVELPNQKKISAAGDFQVLTMERE